MSEAAPPSPRSEPLLWLQLLALGVLPLEALLLLLLLAGSDPGPLPALERLLCWALGVLAPAFLLWRRPADVWSLLLVQVPLRGRRPLQHRLSALQGTPLLQAGLLLGCGLAFALLWWSDRHAALASAFSPLLGSPRLVVLLLCAALLALLLWQWQQLLQALWLLSRPPAAVAAVEPMASSAVADQRLPLGIPLLLLDPLVFAAPSRLPEQPAVAAPPLQQIAVVAAASPLPAPQPPLETISPPGPPGPRASADPPPVNEEPAEASDAEPIPAPDSGGDIPVTVEPEQSGADQQGGALDQQIG